MHGDAASRTRLDETAVLGDDDDEMHSMADVTREMSMMLMASPGSEVSAQNTTTTSGTVTTGLAKAPSTSTAGRADPGPAHQKQHKVLVLTGPTAVGKTATSIAIAKALNGEIISADSVQVYRGLDIGSAKITEEEMSGVIHHCIDILEPDEEFSAGMFHSLATGLIKDICDRGKTPIVVGGTGFYLRWLVSGRPKTPESTKCSEEQMRAALQEVWNDEMDETQRWDAGVALVRRLGDDETADRLDVQERNNWYRMGRVVDILLQRPGMTLRELDRDAQGDGKFDFRCFFLVRDREALYRRIDYRVELMMEQGWMAEAYEQLAEYLGVTEESNQTCASRSIGYRHILDCLAEWKERTPVTHPEHTDGVEKVCRWVTEEDVLELTRSIQAATRQYSNKQLAWFRKEPAFRWIMVEDDAEKHDGTQIDEGIPSAGSLTTPSTGPSAESSTAKTNKTAEMIIDMYNASEPPTGPDELKEHRMTKQEERKMRSYMPEFRVLKPESDALNTLVDQANRIVARVVSSNI